MKRQHQLVIALATVHFALISAKAFGNLERGNTILRRVPALNRVVETVTELTVLQADYGFFSPNVASGSRVAIQTVDARGDTTNVALRMFGNEVALRFHTSLTVFRAVEPYRELVARSLAAKAYMLRPDAALVVVSAYDRVLPSRRQYRGSARESEALFFRAVFSTSRGRAAGRDASPGVAGTP